MVSSKLIQFAMKLKTGRKGEGVMEFYDQHCHTFLSFDSEETPNSYVELGQKVLTFTEHLDLENPSSDGRDDIPDFATMVNWQQEMKDEGIRILLGVEIGYVPGQKERLDSILAQFPFDIKLLSCHQNRVYDYMDTPATNSAVESGEVMMDNYVDQLLEAVNEFTDAHIMTHFDYGFRVHDVSLETIKEKYTDKFIEIFKQLVKNDMAFELNSKSIVKYNKRELYEWAIPLYQSVGGKLFALGSDAHVASDYMLGFDDLRDLLKQFDVHEVALFERDQLKLVNLAELEFKNQ